MRKYIDLKDKKFGRLTVKERVPKHKHGNAIWLCQCDCGTKIEVMSSNLRSGHTQSCGCLYKELRSTVGFRHGHNNINGQSPTYMSWASMKERCNNLKSLAYKWYGGRGIKVCERWNSSRGFINFLEDMGERPKGTTIERINNDGDYEPSNCRWATMKEQNENKRIKSDSIHKVLYTINGISKTVAQWAGILGISHTTLKARMKVFNWDVEKALTTPNQRPRKVK